MCGGLAWGSWSVVAACSDIEKTFLLQLIALVPLSRGGERNVGGSVPALSCDLPLPVALLRDLKPGRVNGSSSDVLHHAELLRLAFTFQHPSGPLKSLLGFFKKHFIYS